jgi:hypothetical protein
MTEHKNVKLIKLLGTVKSKNVYDDSSFVKRLMHNDTEFIQRNGIICKDMMGLAENEIIKNNVFASNTLIPVNAFNKFMFLIIYNFYYATINHYWIRINPMWFQALDIDNNTIRQVLTKLSTLGYIRRGIDYEGYTYVKFKYPKLCDCTLTRTGFIESTVADDKIKLIDPSIDDTIELYAKHLLNVLLKKATEELFFFLP